MDLGLKGKVAVVTGRSLGIGRAITEELLKEGAVAAVCGRRMELLERTREELTGQGYQIYCEACDVTDLPSMQRFADHVEERFGGIDIWVNNAGTNILKHVDAYTEEEYDRIMDTNLKSVFFLSRIAAEKMKKRGGGVILNASSFAVGMAHANGVIYAMSKAGVMSFCQSAAAVYAPWNIRVVNYRPGLITTPLSAEQIRENPEKYVKDIPLRRAGEPREIAGAVAFLASERASYITGVELVIHGGKFAVQDAIAAWKDM